MSDPRPYQPPEPAPVRGPDPEITVITGLEGPPPRRYPWQVAPAPEPAEEAAALLADLGRLLRSPRSSGGAS